jgi:hypothetical protein
MCVLVDLWINTTLGLSSLVTATAESVSHLLLCLCRWCPPWPSTSACTTAYATPACQCTSACSSCVRSGT